LTRLAEIGARLAGRRVESDEAIRFTAALAHYMADLQDDASEELLWVLRALEAANLLTDALPEDEYSQAVCEAIALLAEKLI